MLFRPAYMLQSFAVIAYSEIVGNFNSDLCVDSAGFENCFAETDTWLSACINKNCAGGGDACTKACDGDANCMVENCPNLGSDCVSACECTQHEKEIICVSQSCWNQVSGVLTLAVNVTHQALTKVPGLFVRIPTDRWCLHRRLYQPRS